MRLPPPGSLRLRFFGVQRMRGSHGPRARAAAGSGAAF